jgi:recombination protein RecT
MLNALVEFKIARNSFLQESLRAAADGLVVDGRECALNLSNRNVGTPDSKQWVKVFQYMPMVQGITKTIYNTGIASNVSTGVIYENDIFDFDVGSQPFVRHRPAPKGRGERIYAFASVNLKGHDYPIVEIMTADEVDAIRGRTNSKKKDGTVFGPWETDTSEMWRKTVLRRLSKRLPRSAEKAALLDSVISAMDEDFDLDQTPLVADNYSQTPPVSDDYDQRPEEERLQASTRGMPKGLEKTLTEGAPF